MVLRDPRLCSEDVFDLLDLHFMYSRGIRSLLWSFFFIVFNLIQQSKNLKQKLGSRDKTSLRAYGKRTKQFYVRLISLINSLSSLSERGSLLATLSLPISFDFMKFFRGKIKRFYNISFLLFLRKNRLIRLWVRPASDKTWLEIKKKFRLFLMPNFFSLLLHI